jgi:hypothetical protein
VVVGRVYVVNSDVTCRTREAIILSFALLKKVNVLQTVLGLFMNRCVDGGIVL